MKLNINKKHIILVDASYNTFYRFFATLRWYQLAHKEKYKEIDDKSKYDWYKDKIFREKYEKMYIESIEKFLGKDILENCMMIFCQDAKQSTLWRHKLVGSSEFPEQYKGERPDLDAKHNFRNLFDFTYNKLLSKLKKEKNYPIYKLKFGNTEADDIIAVITLYLKKKLPGQKIIIVSGDDDFTQLGRDNVSILNYRKKKLITFEDGECEDKLRLKIIMGDKSDNIPGIFPKSRKEVSLKTRKAVKESMIEMVKFLDENPEIKKKFELNEKLIDFRKIPKKIQNPIIKEFKKLKL